MIGAPFGLINFLEFVGCNFHSKLGQLFVGEVSLPVTRIWAKGEGFSS
jgi:hypothetical protein